MAFLLLQSIWLVPNSTFRMRDVALDKIYTEKNV